MPSESNRDVVLSIHVIYLALYAKEVKRFLPTDVNSYDIDHHKVDI